MNIVNFKKILKLFIDLKFSIFLLIVIAAISSLGSFIEQDENTAFYEENYPINRPIYGFITYKTILFLGLDHVYINWWFLLLLVILAISLIGCTISRQFPLFYNSKEYFFKTNN